MKMLSSPRRSLMPSLDVDFDSFFDRFSPSLFRMEEPMGLTDWNPAVDIREEPDHYLVKVDVPGVDPKDVNITLENGMLTISGERKEEKSAQDGHYHREERFHGSFYRRFSLPDAADAEKVSARSEKGVVEITIPRSKKTKASRITVKT